jgi:hypothetical protein
VQETDPEWQYRRGQYEAALADLRRIYPAFSEEIGTMQEQALDPRILKYARTIAREKVFADLPIGQALNDYLKLRDGIRAEMQRLGVTSIDSRAAEDTGLAARYQQGVQAIVQRVPEFQRLWQVMFEGADLMRVRPEIELRVEQLPADVRDRLFEWQRRWNDTENQLAVAIDERAKAALYDKQADLLREAYTEFPADVNPVRYWYETQDYGTRQEILHRAYLKNPAYMTRFDRDLLGIQTSDAAEQRWRLYLEARSKIFELDMTDPNYSMSDGFKALDAWVREQAAADPVFAAQVQLANTWGGAFWQSEFLKQDGPAGDAWRALMQTTLNYQSAIERAGLHGTEGDEELYTKYRREWLDYVQMLREKVPTFAAQWDALEKASAGNLAESFYPKIWFRLGGS